MTPIDLSGPFSIFEDDSYGEAREALCEAHGLDVQRFDAITDGATWALARDPLSWEQITDDLYAIAIRGGGVHPDFVIVAAVDMSSGTATLKSIAEA